MSDAISPTTDATVTVTAAPESTPWISKIADAEIVGAAQTKGWDKLDPTEAFAQAVKAHRNAEKMIGAPADQLVRLPTRQDDEAGWRSVWQKLGAPEKPEDYDLAGLELHDPELTERFQTAIRQTAAELNMPKAMAERIAQTFHKFIDDTGQRVDAETASAVQAEADKLASEWGKPGTDRFRANMFVADKAAEQLGVTPEALAKLKDGLGAAEVALLFNRIGRAMGEDRFVTGQNPANQGVMSKEQAVARRTELMNDAQWVTRYLAGGAPEKREMLALNNMIVGGE